MLGVLIAVLVTMVLALIRAFLGPTAYDRMLAMSMFGTKTVLLIAVGGHALGWTSFVDVALLYAMLNFVGTIAIKRFFEHESDVPDGQPGGAGNDS